MFENFEQQVRFYMNAEVWPERKTMDTTKFKSVTIGIGTWKKLNELASKDLRSVSRTIEYLVHEHDYLTKKYTEGNSTLTPEAYFKSQGKANG
jgi:macrodomain Ter protein organizer (MatP/YcbG family)|tara:strand:+ start:98 stop:376 length:279 start_codon:yes stop_codon:yes gene_type:complete